MAIEDVFQEFRRNLGRDYVCSGVIGLDGVHLAFDSIDPGHDEVKAAAELADGLKDVMDMARETDSGKVHYVSIATERFKLFLYPVGGSGKYFSSLTIKADGNVGKAILELAKAERLLDKELV